MSRLLPILLFFFAVDCAIGGPFQLIRPEVVPVALLSYPVVEGSPDGFLAVGTEVSGFEVSTSVLAFDSAGNALTVTPRRTGLPSAGVLLRPVRIGHRWLIGAADQQNVSIAEVRPDGALAGIPIRYPWPETRAVVAAWNGRSLLLATLGPDGKVVARKLASDLSVVGPAVVAASVLQPIRVELLPRRDGFLLTYQGYDGHMIVRLDDDGRPTAPPVRLNIDPGRSLRVTIRNSDDGTLVSWMDPYGVIRVAALEPQPAEPITIGTAEWFERQANGNWGSVDGPYVQAEGDGFAIVWLEAGYRSNVRRTRIGFRRVNHAGQPTGPLVLRDTPADATLLGVATSDSGILLHIGRGFGPRAMWGALVTESSIGDLRPMTMGPASVRLLRMTAADSATPFGVWLESSASYERLMAGAWDRMGRKIATRELRRSESAYMFGIDVAAGGGQNLVVWAEVAGVFGRFVRSDTSPIGEPFLIAQSAFELEASGITPSAAWNGAEFVVVWSERGRLAGATVTHSGVHRFSKLLPEPSQTQPTRRGYSPAIAATVDSFVVVQALIEPRCPHCGPTPIFEEYARFDRDGTLLDHSVREAVADSLPAVATDGRDYAIVANGADGIRARIVDGSTGIVGSDRLLFPFPSPRPAAIAWNGTNYTVAWSYVVAGGTWTPRAAAMLLDRHGRAAGPIRLPRVGASPKVAPVAGDALVSGLEMGEFLSASGTASPPPSEPVVALARGNSFWELSWAPVPRAVSYAIQIRSEGAWWIHRYLDADAASIRLNFSPSVVRVYAIDENGSSQPAEVEIPIPFRRRAARR